MPVYYWTTYEPCGDDRDGGVLFPAIVLCPLSWVLAVVCYVQVWQTRRVTSRGWRMAFYILTSLLVALSLSTALPEIRFYARIIRL